MSILQGLATYGSADDYVDQRHRRAAADSDSLQRGIHNEHTNYSNAMRLRALREQDASRKAMLAAYGAGGTAPMFPEGEAPPAATERPSGRSTVGDYSRNQGGNKVRTAPQAVALPVAKPPVVNADGSIQVQPAAPRHVQDRIALAAPGAALATATTALPITALNAVMGLGTGAVNLGRRFVNAAAERPVFEGDLEAPRISPTWALDNLQHERIMAEGKLTGPEKMKEMKAADAARPAAAVPAGGTSRADRNNNPGNIRLSNIQWQGQVQGSDPEFVTFATPEAGMQAMKQNLLTYQNKHGLNTVQGIIERWSPAAGVGNTAASTNNYTSSVARALGVQPTQPIDLNDPATLNAMASAMAVFERGGAGPATTSAALVPQAAQQPANLPAAQQPAEKPYGYLDKMTPGAIFATNTSGIRGTSDLQRLSSDRERMARMLPHAYSVEQQMQLHASISGMDAQIGDYQLKVLARAAAMGNPRALSGLANAMHAQTNTPFSLQDHGGGMYSVVMNGKASEPRHMSDLAAMFHGNLSRGLQEQAAKQAAGYQESLMKSRGTAEGAHQFKMAELQATGQNALDVATVKSLSDLHIAILNHRGKDDFVLNVDSVNNRVYIHNKSGGRIGEYQPAGTKIGKLVSDTAKVVWSDQ